MDVRISFKGGGRITQCAPVFSHGEEYIYVPWKNNVLCYYTKTGKRARELSGLRDNVVGLNVVNLDEKESVFACSITGEIFSWDLGHSHPTVKEKIPLTNVIIRKFQTIIQRKKRGNHKIIHLLSWTENKMNSSSLSIGLYDLSEKILTSVKITLQDVDHQISVGGSSSPFFAIVQGKKLYFARLKDDNYIHKRQIQGRTFTAVACHPNEECVLTGDNTGRVLLWHGLSTSSPSQAVYHWHTLPVKALAFSHMGTYFFSGADECVLVKWNIENPNEKQFLPRLASTIEHVSVSGSNSFVAVTTGDNAVNVLDFRLQRVSLIQHLVLPKEFSAGLHHDPKTGALFMNGIVGHLQFYIPKDMSLLYNLDITGRNKITNEREYQIENTDVIKVAMDKNGKWLGTVEKRNVPGTQFELRLKFWLFDFKKQEYILNTCIELPHGDKDVEAISFQPTSDENQLRCITVGGDTKFKIWEVVNADTIYNKGEKWICFATGFYKDLPCNCLDFSSDGSVFGISFDFTVTLWETETCEFKYSLSCPQLKGQQVTNLKFGSSSRCQLLVTTTETHVVLWNLLTLSAIWIVRVNVSLLISSYFSSYMAIFTKDYNLIVFDPNNPSPEFFSEELKKCRAKVITAAFVPSSTFVDSEKKHWCSNTRLYFVDANQELYCFESTKAELEDVNVELLEAEEKKTAFGTSIPKLKSDHVIRDNRKEHKIIKYTDIKKIREFLDVPVNTMAPISLSCETILKLLVEKKIQ